MQDTGFARAILNEYAYEIVLWVSRPAKLGETLQLHCTIANTNTSELRFEEAGAPERDPDAVDPLEIPVSKPEDAEARVLTPTESLEVGK